MTAVPLRLSRCCEASVGVDSEGYYHCLNCGHKCEAYVLSTCCGAKVESEYTALRWTINGESRMTHPRFIRRVCSRCNRTVESDTA
jgi:hypothetical protein